MTSIDLPLTAATGTAAADRAPAAVAERRLRLVLAANAATSLAAGAVGLAATGWAADVLDVAATGWVRLVSAVLVVFALDVAWVARARRERLRPGAALVSAVDAAWVVATAVLVAAGAFGAVGTAVAVAMGVGVLDFALLQMHLRRRSAA